MVPELEPPVVPELEPPVVPELEPPVVPVLEPPVVPELEPPVVPLVLFIDGSAMPDMIASPATATQSAPSIVRASLCILVLSASRRPPEKPRS